MADTGLMGGRYMPHAPPIVGRYGKRPHSRMRRLQLRTRPNRFTTRPVPHLLELVARIVGVAAPIVVRVRGGLVRALGDGLREIFVRQFMQNFGRAKSLIPLAGRDEPEPDIVFRSPTHPWPSQWLGEGPLRVVSEAARPAKSPRARGGVRGARWGEPHTVTLGLKPFRTRRGRRPAVKQARRRRFQAWCRDEILRRLLTDVANEPGSFLRSSWALAANSS